MTHIIALLDGKPGAYGVVFPDAPGCTAMGFTIDEALSNARAALAEWLADGPVPFRTIEELRIDAEVQAALAEGTTLVVMDEPRRVADLEEKVAQAYQVVGVLVYERVSDAEAQRALDYFGWPGFDPEFLPFAGR